MVDFKLPKSSTILVDTNFFIDLFSHQTKYRELLSEFESKEIVLVSCDFVKCEFIRTKDKQKLEEKTKLFNETISTLLPLDIKISELLVPIMAEYSTDLDGIELTDLFLGAFIKRYPGLYLLTRNHKDFPTRIFTRSHVFSIEHDRDVKTYALYQYKKDKLEVEAEVIPF
jgi:predicted nucleic acid-binding protein